MVRGVHGGKARYDRLSIGAGQAVNSTRGTGPVVDKTVVRILIFVTQQIVSFAQLTSSYAPTVINEEALSVSILVLFTVALKGLSP